MTTTIVNDALVKLDNVVGAANYLLEELQTRQDNLLNEESVMERTKEVMNSYDYRDMICSYIRNQYGEGICREVAFYVMERIDSDIEAFINDRVNKALVAAGVSPQS